MEEEAVHFRKVAEYSRATSGPRCIWGTAGFDPLNQCGALYRVAWHGSGAHPKGLLWWRGVAEGQWRGMALGGSLCGMKACAGGVGG